MPSVKEQFTIRCPKCESEQTFDAVRVADAAEEPEYKESILNGTLNVFNCTECEAKLHNDSYLLYTDPAKGLL
ncbi:MAG: hypothetical protein JNL74_12850, partial [Fibrobacteres bacterium]|nr:hypothetical protein [Fibrobacterota bacterium]